MITHYYSLLEHQPETPSSAVNYKTISKLLHFSHRFNDLRNPYTGSTVYSIVGANCLAVPSGQESADFM